MLKGAAARAKRERTTDEDSCREAVELSEQLWSMFPPSRITFEHEGMK